MENVLNYLFAISVTSWLGYGCGLVFGIVFALSLHYEREIREWRDSLLTSNQKDDKIDE